MRASMSNWSRLQSSSVLKITFTSDGVGDQVLTNLADLVAQLGRLGVDGPRHFRSPSLAGRGRLIGSGAQFEVFEDKVGAMPNVVFKRVKVSDLYTTAVPLDHELRARLRTIEREIKSLCDPFRRLNRNIVDLISWGYDYPTSDLKLRIPVLIMEKALYSLADALQESCIDMLGFEASAIHHHLSLDIASGLQSVHESNLAHGDLKPANILVFRQKHHSVPYTAKLSDFGQCIELDRHYLNYEVYRGTDTWKPPETWTSENCRAEIDGRILVKSDAYVYGLVVTSLFLSYSNPIRDTGCDQPLELSSRCVAELENLNLGPSLLQRLQCVTRSLLDPNPELRPSITPDLLRCDGGSYDHW